VSREAAHPSRPGPISGLKVLMGFSFDMAASEHLAARLPEKET